MMTASMTPPHSAHGACVTPRWLPVAACLLALAGCEDAPVMTPVEGGFDGAAGSPMMMGTGGTPAGDNAVGSGGMVSGDGDAPGGEFAGGQAAATGDGTGQGPDDGTETMDPTDPADPTMDPPAQPAVEPAQPAGPVVGDNGGTCGGDTPHGCYSIAPSQLAECPEVPPELPWKYAGCNGVAPAAACTYENAGKMFDCICDTGVHWLCFYID